jgi:hypothetical protein
MGPRCFAPVAVGCKEEARPRDVATPRAELRCGIERPLDRELRLPVRVAGVDDATLLERRCPADGYVRACANRA